MSGLVYVFRGGWIVGVHALGAFTASRLTRLYRNRAARKHTRMRRRHR
jgi:hypothetical protein